MKEVEAHDTNISVPKDQHTNCLLLSLSNRVCVQVHERERERKRDGKEEERDCILTGWRFNCVTNGIKRK